MGKIKLDLVNLKRECGECKACCTTKAVVSLAKPKDVPCDYLCEIGCSVHQDKPMDCKTYRCLWLQGYLTESQRPDKVGYILDIDREEKTGLQVYATVPATIGGFEGDLKETMVYRHKRLAKQLKQPVIANGLSLFADQQFRVSVFKVFGPDIEVTWV